jgi:hypothetical protein
MACNVPAFNSSLGFLTIVKAVPSYNVWWLPLPRDLFNSVVRARRLSSVFTLKVNSIPVIVIIEVSDENVRNSNNIGHATLHHEKLRFSVAREMPDWRAVSNGRH